jgi:hypothetical protein
MVSLHEKRALDDGAFPGVEMILDFFPRHSIFPVEQIHAAPGPKPAHFVVQLGPVGGHTQPPLGDDDRTLGDEPVLFFEILHPFGVNLDRSGSGSREARILGPRECGDETDGNRNEEEGYEGRLH